jgi:cellulose synthase/poly-beta-1,6-N-acetylglucosamine synthase-like glycosyltransferase
MTMAGPVTLIAAFCLLALALHPFVTYPLSLKVLARLRARPVAPAEGAPMPSFAVCVCAYNEEAVIEDKVRNLLEMRAALGGRLEILVYVDAATDRTAEILRRHEHELTLVVSPQRYGKTHGMNRLVAMAGADIVVFTDANVRVDPEALPRLARYFADPDVGCVCGVLTYVNEDETPTAASGALYWRLEEAIKQLESDTGSVMGADGSVFAIRRDLHRPVPDDIIDDFFVSLSILCDGRRVVRAPDVHAFEKSATSSGDEFRRKVRISCQAVNVHRLLWPRLSGMDGLTLYKYISHKWLRWMTAFLLAGAGLSGLAFLWTVFGGAGLAAAAATATAFVLADRLGVGKVRMIREILSAFAATAVGVLRSYRGDRFQTWSPAQSVRRAQ